jgi:hypothetical protein
MEVLTVDERSRHIGRGLLPKLDRGHRGDNGSSEVKGLFDWWADSQIGLVRI